MPTIVINSKSFKSKTQTRDFDDLMRLVLLRTGNNNVHTWKGGSWSIELYEPDAVRTETLKHLTNMTFLSFQAGNNTYEGGLEKVIAHNFFKSHL